MMMSSTMAGKQLQKAKIHLKRRLQHPHIIHRKKMSRLQSQALNIVQMGVGLLVWTLLSMGKKAGSIPVKSTVPEIKNQVSHGHRGSAVQPCNSCNDLC